MSITRIVTLTLFLISLLALRPAQGAEVTNGEGWLDVKITRQIESVEVSHQGRTVTIQRNQDIHNTINPDFARTSRKCPPFCIQKMVIAPGVETIGERDLLDYLEQITDGDDSIVVIDSRTPRWLEKGTIPGSINLPYKLLLDDDKQQQIIDILVDGFDVERNGELFNFKHAKTLVLFCNGPWCGQSPSNIRALLKLGYPPHKLKYYRGGMQLWESFALTTVKPGE